MHPMEIHTYIVGFIVFLLFLMESSYPFTQYLHDCFNDNDCPSASKLALKDVGKIHCHINKQYRTSLNEQNANSFIFAS